MQFMNKTAIHVCIWRSVSIIDVLFYQISGSETFSESSSTKTKHAVWSPSLQSLIGMLCSHNDSALNFKATVFGLFGLVTRKVSEQLLNLLKTVKVFGAEDWTLPCHFCFPLQSLKGHSIFCSLGNYM